MSSHVMLSHHTRYQYDRPVFLGPQTIRLRPVATSKTPVRAYALRIAPPYSQQTWQRDVYGNDVAQVVFAERVTHFDITVQLEADLAPRNPFDFVLTPDVAQWVSPADRNSASGCVGMQQSLGGVTQRMNMAHAANVPFRQPFYQTMPDAAELSDYWQSTPLGPTVRAFVQEWAQKAPIDTLEMLVALNRVLAAQIGYQVRLEPGIWSPEETLSRGTGSCRDSAWLLIAILRHLGFAARFVSGYLVQATRNAVGEEVLTCDLHAWAETFLPSAGWVGFDTTSGLLTAQGHVPLAATPQPEHAAPVSGLLDQCQAVFDVSMQAQRLFINADC
ncbi:transglutaminase family protein [Acetobacter indonesiensis]|uniref:transglutaminase family protein n=1 Tax=Acetobacter indonesiensis TaxID=104101 RepID=UPI001F3EAFDF|nr:transglutaminase family protein [Acetobacter indonesiensis]MCG0993586.1 transglutaminase family protein [Acetobacter indonesiensis]